VTGDPLDDDAVAEVCRLVADQPGDPERLVVDGARRVAPLYSAAAQAHLARRALARLTGLGELDTFLSDPEIDEILVNAGGDVWIDRAGTLQHVGALRSDRIEHLVERLLAPLGRRVDRSSPIVDARLPDGSRVCVALPPVAVDGAAMSIRRFARHRIGLASFAESPVAALLREVLNERCNVVVSGATSSGKTSLVGSLLSLTTPNERLVLIEDTCELAVDHPHVVRLEARPPSVEGPEAIDLTRLLRTALRLRPDRLVVGEVRGDEVLALVQAMNTGHDGTFSTCHANGPADALLRLESLVLQAAPSWPVTVVRHHLGRSLDVVVHVERDRGTPLRRVVAVSEVGEVTAHSTDEAIALRPLALRDGDGRVRVVGTLRRGRR
jgi:pilus assembly protein CpaF